MAANAPGARSSRRAASGACNVTAALPSMPSAAAPVCPAAERGSSGSPLRSTAQTTLVRNARSARLAASHGPYGLQGQRGRVRSAAEHVHVPGPTPADGAPDFVHPVAPSRGGSHTLLSRVCSGRGRESCRFAIYQYRLVPKLRDPHRLWHSLFGWPKSVHSVPKSVPGVTTSAPHLIICACDA